MSMNYVMHDIHCIFLSMFIVLVVVGTLLYRSKKE